MSQPIIPQQVFKQAGAFEMTSIKLSTLPGADAVSIYIPSVVNLIFALELYLKCLILLETGKSPHGHNLKSLFSLVSPNAQQKIKNIYKESLDKNPHIEREAKDFADLLQKHTSQIVNPSTFAYTGVDFDTIIDECKDAFQQFRYIFEPSITTNKINFATLGLMSSAIKQAILDLEPKWIDGNARAGMQYFVVISANEEFKQIIARKPPTIDSNIIGLKCGTCDNNLCLAYTLAPGVRKKFPHRKDGRIVLLWPKEDRFICSRCRTINDVAPLREYIENYTGSKIQQAL